MGPLEEAAVIPNPNVRTVRLYGKLGAKFGRKFRLAVSSVAEAVQALCVLLPGFEAELTGSKDRGVTYAVFIGKRNIGETELQHPVGGGDIRIAPVIVGSKRNGVLQTIVGVVLIVVGTVFSAWLGPAAAPIVKLGWSMAIGGVIQMLTPVPRGNSSKDKPENQSSYNFNGAINTQAQGNCVPLLYGRMIVGSAVISAGISVKDQAYVPVVGTGSGGGAPPWWDENNINTIPT